MPDKWREWQVFSTWVPSRLDRRNRWGHSCGYVVLLIWQTFGSHIWLYRKRKRLSIEFLLLSVFIFNLIFVSQVAQGQGPESNPTLNSPVTALFRDGDRLLIGQDETLIDAQVMATDLNIKQIIPLKQGTIHSITINGTITLALSDNGLTTLDPQGKIIDFMSGGGQRLAVRGERIYIASPTTGVQILSFAANGKLTPLGKIPGVARDVAAESSQYIFVAQDKQGVGVYSLKDPANPQLTARYPAYNPATLVRLDNLRLYIAYGDQIAILQTIDLNNPRLIGSVNLKGAQISDLALQDNRAVVGLNGNKEPDFVGFDLSKVETPTEVTRFGTQGQGQTISWHGTDLFVGSAVGGLQRIQFEGSPVKITLVKAWANTKPKLVTAVPTDRNNSQLNSPTEIVAAPTSGKSVLSPTDTITVVVPTVTKPAGCEFSLPLKPSPPNLSTITTPTIKLTWIANCALHYELSVNGKVVASLDKPEYNLTAPPGGVSWQVTAIDVDGNRSEGPIWQFDVTGDGWVATPLALPLGKLISHPPLMLLDLSSPRNAIFASCAVLLLGLAAIVVTSILLGRRVNHKSAKKPANYL